MADKKNEYAGASAPSTVRAQDDSDRQPPAYAPEQLPPQYSASAYLRSLRDGDPQEKIDVPMIHNVQKHGIGDYLPFGSAGKTKARTVIARPMTRDTYLKHYAKDDEGNYVGTEKMYPDAHLVFVPGKSTEDGMIKQLEELVAEKQSVRNLHAQKSLR